MTAPSDFLDVDRFDDDGGSNHERIEEAWDEPIQMSQLSDPEKWTLGPVESEWLDKHLPRPTEE